MWVNAAIQCGIENLDIKLSTTNSVISLNCFNSNCRTLVVVKLNGLDVGAFSSVDLPSLKTLHLNNVGFLKPQYVKELLCVCPILEDLQAEDIYCEGPRCEGEYKTLTKLVRAVISQMHHLNIPLQAVSNAEFLRIDKYSNVIPVFPNLTHLEVLFGSDIKWHLVFTMLKQIPKLQNFVLDVQSDSAHVDWPYPNFVPQCLSSKLRKCSILNYGGTECELLFAKYVLRNSRVLRSMKIYRKSSRDKFEMLKELCLCPRSSPQCELSFE
ncbi:Leucine-rich repeat domain superfamily [Sesbania bispinosa]|nr:Leucine-rich repeat domain superfamily [Sesbania bispinosa]